MVDPERLCIQLRNITRVTKFKKAEIQDWHHIFQMADLKRMFGDFQNQQFKNLLSEFSVYMTNYYMTQSKNTIRQLLDCKWRWKNVQEYQTVVVSVCPTLNKFNEQELVTKTIPWGSQHLKKIQKFERIIADITAVKN